MKIGVLTLELEFTGCKSLKEKRSRIKPLLARLGREFNVSVAEIDRQDRWQEAVIACAMAGNSEGQVQHSLHEIVDWVENFWPDASLIDDQIEILY